ncbi:MAG TPA: L,D-transpeptidase [Polyangiaceae bacterium]|nr:L,D-transpeptidase [Polyangiaceae bacterium]
MIRSPRRSSLPALALLAAATACSHGTEPAGDDAGAAQPSRIEAQPGAPNLPPELKRAPSANASGSASATPSSSSAPLDDAGAPAPVAAGSRPLSAFPQQPDHPGPWFVVTSPAAGVYSEPSFERSTKIGWVRSGGKLPVRETPVSRKGCTPGWYEVVGGGFICGNYGTTNLASPDVKFAMTPPNLDDVLPYAYARNAKHGTPLYHSVPSREQMLKYEPYLLEKKAEPPPSPAAAGVPNAAAAAAAAATPSPVAQVSIATVDAGVPLDPGMTDAGIEEPDKPWWQQDKDQIKEHLHELKLDSLSEDADAILAKRMVQGFFVAIDRTFKWNDRTWYKTTKTLIAPAERFWQTGASKFQGVELDGERWKLPVAWGYGGRKQVSTYLLDEAKKQLRPAKSIDRQVAIELTGRATDVGGAHYLETSENSWIKANQVRVTEPGAAPAGLGPDERWIDVDLSTQTLVAFVGTRAVYATLISSGKESKDKDKDHRTPTGEFRIREKHITTTMDGDGTAAGDLPYSIEDVPYVEYFYRAYALHGAFWHSNYGVQMSHGCVNLSPLDAKWLFFFTSPEFRAGFHGMWARPEGSGTRVIIHD